MFKTFFVLLYLLITVSVIGLILMQGRGAGLGSAWGGSGETFSTRRGVERVTFYITISVIGLFFVLSVVYLFI